MDNTVALVITSCDRFDLLEKTLESFFKHNTYELNEIIITEDSNKEEKLNKILHRYKNIYNIKTIINKTKLGQLKSIDNAYSHVNSKYVFHCEDDWKFLKDGFIEKSIQILKNKKILSVWLRDIKEYDTINFSNEIYTTNNINYKLVYNEILSFNPGLRRYEDYKLIEKFSKFSKKGFESDISNFYINKGFYSSILSEAYVEHMGWHRRVLNANKKRIALIYTMDNFVKKIKAKIYKVFKLGKFKQY